MVKQDRYVTKSHLYLNTLCSVKPNRRTGSAGNWAATNFFVNTIRPYGFEIDATPFECLDYVCHKIALTHEGDPFEVYISPYSLECDIYAELITISTFEELENTNCENKILLLRGEICSEQLMPKNFIFYNPDHHKKIIALIESSSPAGIITSTESKPEQVGALYPFPLIVDGDFNIPVAFCRDTEGAEIAKFQGDSFHLKIDANRITSSAANVIARLNHDALQKMVITAHIDAYEDTPGASDNASGIVVLLLLAEMLSDYHGDKCIEIAALNGEDHYSAGGQMDYLNRYGSEFNKIFLAVNVDDVGYKKGRSSYSFYGCFPHLEKVAMNTFRSFTGLVHGDPWFNGDHMIFVQNQIPAVALTSECMPELMKTVTHTSADTPDILNGHKLVEVAESLNALVHSYS